MKFTSIFLSLIAVSEGAYSRPDFLDDYNLRIKKEETVINTQTKILSAYIDKKQNFICPGDQEFSLFMVYEQTDYEQCNTGYRNPLHTCYKSTWDTQQEDQVSEQLIKRR